MLKLMRSREGRALVGMLVAFQFGSVIVWGLASVWLALVFAAFSVGTLVIVFLVDRYRGAGSEAKDGVVVFSISMSKENAEELSRMSRLLGIDQRARVLNIGISFVDWAIRVIRSGGTIMVMTRSGQLKELKVAEFSELEKIVDIRPAVRDSDESGDGIEPA